MLFKQDKKNNGFTLIETIVAIFIMSLVVVAYASLVRQSAGAVFDAKDRLVAVYLTQDALEYVRVARSDNFLTPGNDNWLVGMESCESPGMGKQCYLDSRCDHFNGTTCTTGGDYLEPCPSAGCPRLKYNATLGVYGYENGSEWEETMYTRSVALERLRGSEQDDNDVELRVTVRVSWERGGRTHEVVGRTNLFNVISL